MEHATQSKQDRRPLTGDKGTAVTTVQANATDEVSSETSGASIGSKQDTRAEAKEVNKRSLDYVLRSGYAGGLAGCAVSAIHALAEGYELTVNARRKQWLRPWTG